MKKNLVCVPIMLIALTLTACTSSPDSAPADTNTNNTVSSEDTTSSDAGNSEDSENLEDITSSDTNDLEDTNEDDDIPEQGNLFMIGDTTSLGDWEITLDSVEFKDSIPGSLGRFLPDDGNTYLYALVTVTNLGTSPATFLKSFSVQGVDITTDILYDNTFTFH